MMHPFTIGPFLVCFLVSATADGEKIKCNLINQPTLGKYQPQKFFGGKNVPELNLDAFPRGAFDGNNFSSNVKRYC